MKLPRFTATTPPPRETGLARAQDIGALTRTGGAEFEAIAGAGRAIQQAAAIGTQAYMDRQALDDQQKMGEISIKSQEAEKQGVDSIGLIDMVQSRPLPNDPDYYKGDKIPDSETWAKSNEKVFADYKKKIISLSTAIKNPKTRQRWINAQLIRGNSNFDGISRAKYDEYQQHTILSYARAAASNGDMELSNKWIKIAEKHGLIGPKRAAAARDDNTREYITGLYRVGDYESARKVLEASALSSKDKEQLDDEIDEDERTKLVEFEDGINKELVRIDNTEDMTQADFNTQARSIKNTILVANIPGTKKKKMLSDLENWRKGTNEIDYAKILSLNQEMDAAQRSGIVDPTIQTRIMQASLEGSFGGRLKGGQKTYGDMIRRFEKLQFDERTQAVSFVTRTFERENADDPRLIFLFHQAKNKLVADNPDMSAKELFIEVSGLSEVYGVLPEFMIERKLRTKTKNTIMMTSPNGKRYAVPIEKRQKFIDNGYTE